MKKSLIVSGMVLSILGYGALVSHLPIHNAFAQGSIAVPEDKDGLDQVKWANKATLTSVEAQKTALTKVSGKVLEIDLDKNHGTIVYDVVIYDGSTVKEITLNADTGNVLKVAEDDDGEKKVEHLHATSDVSSKEDDEYGYNQVKWANNAKLSLVKAENLALDEVSGKVLEIDLDKNQGTIVYDVVIYDGSTVKEITLNADTGKILKIAKDDDAEKLEQLQNK
ncbi:PepSY domain-containing protein [Fictibacillus barbaricus]|uniref:Membrane protein YkoI n=1 Tax=Fictibacillus barbaricus TaxID=182136 RepID=A0ABU1U262_9BACL|nr:PepSY domain-containing protein [Fictibacillus barbaricus]MDR7073569.1 putative membrane protein YkoI [Fictibacillus barbaricus]